MPLSSALWVLKCLSIKPLSFLETCSVHQGDAFPTRFSFWPEGWGGRWQPLCPVLMELGMVCLPSWFNYPDVMFVFVEPGFRCFILSFLWWLGCYDFPTCAVFPVFKPFRISLNFLLWYLFHSTFSRPIMNFSCFKISHFSFQRAFGRE